MIDSADDFFWKKRGMGRNESRGEGDRMAYCFKCHIVSYNGNKLDSK